MPTASAPRGLYQAVITTEPCEGGFKAKILRVVLLTLPSPVGTQVDVQFPEHVAESEALAYRRAEIHFKTWAKLECVINRSREKRE